MILTQRTSGPFPLNPRAFPHASPHLVCPQATPRTSTPTPPPLLPTTAPADDLSDIERDNESGPDDEMATAYLQVLLIASAVGLITGGGVVAFNDLVHSVQDHLVWQDMPRLAAFGSDAIAFYEPKYALWRCLLLPPFFAGLAVGGIRFAAGGFSGDPSCVSMRASAPPIQTSSSAVLQQSTEIRNPEVTGTALIRHGPASVNGAVRPAESSTALPRNALQPPAPCSEASTSSSPKVLEAAKNGGCRQAGVPASLLRRKGGWHSLDWEVQSGALREAQKAARPYMKSVAAAASLGSGASLGPEGPSAELGRAIAASVQRYLPLHVRPSTPHMCKQQL
jgi:hypothetical protein